MIASPVKTEPTAGIDPAIHFRVDNFLTDYAHVLDDGLIDEWPQFFTEDAIYQITTLENCKAGYPVGILYCEGRGMISDRVNALKTANIFEAHTYCHILGRPHIWAEGDAIRARCNFSVFRTMEDGEAELFATGKYVDRIELDPNRLQFKQRQVIIDARAIDTLLVFPL